LASLIAEWKSFDYWGCDRDFLKSSVYPLALESVFIQSDFVAYDDEKVVASPSRTANDMWLGFPPTRADVLEGRIASFEALMKGGLIRYDLKTGLPRDAAKGEIKGSHIAASTLGLRSQKQDIYAIEEPIETIYGTFYSYKNDLFSLQLREFSAHTRNEIAMLASFVQPGDHIVDVGAHIGTYSIPFASMLHGSGTVTALEAGTQNISLLKQNIITNGYCGIIKPIHVVASDKDGVLFSGEIPEGGNSGMAQFSEVQGDHSPPDAVSSISLDTLIGRDSARRPIRLIKIDVEGAEVRVLLGARKTIEADRPIIYVEVNETALNRAGYIPRDIGTFLGAFGYTFFRNLGPRNSANDNFVMAPLMRVEDGGAFFDLLAICTD
jgi:FkbM family methyltransferase